MQLITSLNNPLPEAYKCQKRPIMQAKETDSNLIPIFSKNFSSIECVLAVIAHSDQNHGASPLMCVREKERERERATTETN